MREPRWGRYPGISLEEMTVEDAITKTFWLPKAESRPLYTSDGKEIEHFQGIFVDGVAVDCPSYKYAYVNHAEAFGPFLDALKKTVGDSTIRFGTTYNLKRAYCYVSLPEQFKITPNDGKPIELGFMMTNSYDRKTSIGFSGFGFRPFCTNQLSLSTALGYFNVMHTISAHAQLSSIMLTYESKFDELRENIELSRSIAISRDDAVVWLKAHFFKNKREKSVVSPAINRFDIEENSVWGLYQSATWAATSFPDAQERAAKLAALEKLIRIEEPQMRIEIDEAREFVQKREAEEQMKLAPIAR